MKRLIAMLLLASAASFAYDASISYFTRSRTVKISVPDRQNYLLIDADVWRFARPDLSDLRLYDGVSLVPHALQIRSGGSSNQESPAKILNLGDVNGHAEFDLELGEVHEYDRIRLQLDAKNFINNAQVQGRTAVNDRSGPKLGTSTLYDFTAEGLGSNSVLKFPSASFPYLHVRLAPGIRPKQITGAFVSNVAETKAAWSDAGDCTVSSGPPKQSVFNCAVSPGMPVERVVFTLPASAVNFNRTVVVSDDHGEFERGSISRVRVNRAGQTVISENLMLDLSAQPRQKISVAIENGDDVALPIQQVRLLSFERRLYFDPHSKTVLRLYYGDAKLESASYDYQKLFQQQPDSAVSLLGPPEANAEFTGRPDDRPWSERHNGVLWVAMLIAVVLLGGLALRGLKAKPTP